MHIGFIEDTLLHGGTQIWVTEAARYFLDKGETVTILTPQGGWVADECANTNVRVVTYDYANVAADVWGEALRDCDVAVCTVHPPRDSFHCSVFTAKCIREYGLKTVLITKTGTIVPSYKREFYVPDEAIQSRVIAIADFTRRYLIDRYKIPPETVELIYQGADIKTFTADSARKSQAIKQYPLPEHSSPVLGTIGSFEHRKGQEILLEAFLEIVSGPLPNAHLMLVGDGPDEAILTKKVKSLGLTRHISFFPFTKAPVYVYEMLDILVLPSLCKEGLPNVLLEALSMGVPVIASNIAGVPEVVKNGETGYTVEPGHRKQLAETIIKLWFETNLKEQLRQNGRKLIERGFNKPKQFERFLSYFYEITQSNS